MAEIPLDGEGHPYVGLVNQASTCYLNSLIQTLYMTPEFRNALYSWEYTGTGERGKFNLAYQLQRLFSLLQSSPLSTLQTKELTLSFGWNEADAWDQHDIQELYQKMFDALVKKWKDQISPIQRLYEGKLMDSIECIACGEVKTKEDTFFELSLAVKPHGSSVAYSTLIDAFRGFTNTEMLTGRNQYYCDTCSCKQNATKKLDLVQLPYILTIQLKRFDFNYTTLHRIKLNDRIAFPELLDLNDLNGERSQELFLKGTMNAEQRRELVKLKGERIYELLSIMVHSGSAGGGHYYAYIRNVDTNEWLCFNDELITKADAKDLQSTYGGNVGGSLYSYECSASAYMLVYRRIDQDVNESFAKLDYVRDSLKLRLQEWNLEEKQKQQQEDQEKEKINVEVLIVGRNGNGENRMVRSHKHNTIMQLKCQLIEGEIDAEIAGEALADWRLIKVELQQGNRFWVKKSLDDEYLTLSAVFGSGTTTVTVEIKPLNDNFVEYTEAGHTYLTNSVDIQKGVKNIGKWVWAPENATLGDLMLILAKKFNRLSRIRVVMNGRYGLLTLLDVVDRPLNLDFGEYLRIREIYVDLTESINDQWLNDTSLPFQESMLLIAIEAHMHAKPLQVVVPGVNAYRRASIVPPNIAELSQLQPVLEEDQEIRSDSSSPTDNGSQKDVMRNFRIIDTEKLESGDVVLDILVDQRMCLKDLKRNLSGYMQLPDDWFDFSKRMGSFEYDINDLNQLVESALGADRLAVKIKCPLKPEESLVSFYKFDEQLPQDLWKKLFEIALTETTSWEEIMRKIHKALEKFCGLDNIENKVKIREKRAGYLPCIQNLSDRHHKWDHPLVLHIYKRPLLANDITLFVRHWNPTEMSLGQVKQVIINSERGLEKLKWELGQLSRLPFHRIIIGKLANCRGSFPYLTDRLTILDDIKFETEIDKSYLTDGQLLFYRDIKDNARALTDEERKRIQILDKSQTHQSRSSRLRRERSLKIKSQQSSDVPTDEE